MQQGLCRPVAFGVLHLQQGLHLGFCTRGFASPPLLTLHLGFCFCIWGPAFAAGFASPRCIWGFAIRVLHLQQGLPLGFCIWGFASAPLLTLHFGFSFAAGFAFATSPHRPIAHVWGFAFGVLHRPHCSRCIWGFAFAFGALRLQQGLHLGFCIWGFAFPCHSHLHLGFCIWGFAVGVLQLGFCIAPIAHVAFGVLHLGFCSWGFASPPLLTLHLGFCICSKVCLWGFAFAIGFCTTPVASICIWGPTPLHLGFCICSRVLHSGFCICGVPHCSRLHLGFRICSKVCIDPTAFGVLHLQRSAFAPLLTFRVLHSPLVPICIWGFAFAFGALRLQQGLHRPVAFGALQLQRGFASPHCSRLGFFAFGVFAFAAGFAFEASCIWGFAFAFGVLRLQ